MTLISSLSGGGGSVAWSDITGKPTTFAPSAHTHAQSDITDLASDLAGKAAFVHTHSQYDDKWTYLTLGSNSTVSTTAFANVTGMSFSALANTKYLVQLVGAYQTAATTTGLALALDIPTGATIIGQNIVSTSATALGGTEQIADATTTGATTGVRALNTNTPIQASWIVSVGSSSGTIQLMQRSEVAASNTVLQSTLTVLGYRTI